MKISHPELADNERFELSHVFKYLIKIDVLEVEKVLKVSLVDLRKDIFRAKSEIQVDTKSG